MTANILIVPASLRKGSHNVSLAGAAERELKVLGANAERLDLADFPLPVYDGNLESTDGVPDAAHRLADQFRSHSNILLISPEYNAGVSPLLKNAIDWMSRTKGDQVSPFKNAMFALASASPGRLGGLRGLMALRQTLELGLGALVIPEQLVLGTAHQALGPDGQFADQAVEARLIEFLKAILERARHSPD